MISRLLAILVTLTASAGAAAQTSTDWREAEAGTLRGQVQLTFPDRFIKAGESYFSPDDSKVIFQAVEVPAAGEEPEPYYGMFVSDVVRDDGGTITGLANFKRLSPPGSSNTCGWFHPSEPNIVIFGSTIVPPAAPNRAGYQRGTRNYLWQFPKEMTIVRCDVSTADGSPGSLEEVLRDDSAYLAECSFTRDGRHLIFCRYREEEAPAGGDLFVLDLETGREVTLIDAEGYDGGPFFSPDEKQICYRSDRRGDNHLQIFTAELVYGDDGGITGVRRQHQMTNNKHVNWAPFWHPTGSHLVYATSEVGHTNYEVFKIETTIADPRLGLESTKLRITHANKFDGLPVFNRDASLMMWTSQRGEGGSSQLWVAEYLAGGSAP